LGVKTVTEAAVGGWSLTNLVCTGGGANTSTAGSVATIGLDAGENVICTYTNTKDATLTIIKDAIPDDPQDFAFTTTGTGPAAFTAGFSLDDDADVTLPNTRTFTFPAAQLGVKTVTEAAVGGWSLTNLVCTGGGANTSTAGSVATIGLDAGENVICTYTNTKDATLTIIKDAIPDDPQDFAFTTTGTGPAAFTAGFSLDDDADVTLPNTRTFTFPAAQLGVKTVTEAAVSGWGLTNLVCTGGGANTSTAGSVATIGLDAGENVICTYTNTKGSSITIIKDAIPDDPQDFAFTTTGTGPAAFTAGFSLDDDADVTLPNTRTFTFPAAQLGVKTVTEAAVSGWGLTNLVCTGGGANTSTAGSVATIGLDAGENVICTYTNTKGSSITIIKDAIPDDPQDFAFTTTGTGPAAFTAGFSLDDDADVTLPNTRTFTFPAAQLGVKTVTEAAVSGWGLTNLVCTGGGANTSTAGSVATIGLDAGENVICTYTNTKDATLTIIKDAIPDDPQDFAFTTTGTGPAAFTAGFSLDDDADVTLPNTRTFTFPAAQLGVKTVTEAAVGGWSLTNLVCTGGGANTSTAGSVATIGLDAGENVICTYTNTKDATLTIIKDAIPDDAQDFAFTTTGTGPAAFTAGFSLDD